MGFRIRSLRLGVSTLLLVAMTAIPGAWHFQAPGTALGPAISWAGGTPDETLHPQPTPTTKRAASAVPGGACDTTKPGAIMSARSESGPGATLRDRLIALWTFVRATTLRK